VFLLFAGYGIWCVVLHGMSALGIKVLRIKVGGEMLLPRFFLVV
jgi:hypothetical protein